MNRSLVNEPAGTVFFTADGVAARPPGADTNSEWTLAGSRADARFPLEAEASRKRTYQVGRASSRWVENLPSYSRLRRSDVYGRIALPSPPECRRVEWDVARRTRIGIVLFDEVEVLDFAGPFEVFSVARLDESRRREDKSPFDVVLVAEHLAPVLATGGMAVLPHRAFADCPPLDVLVVPGGWGTREQVRNAAMLAWIREQAQRAQIVASVCTGSVLLGVAGQLEGKRATTHWRALDWMREMVPGAIVDASKHFVIDGRVFTSAGISAGIDMSLRLVAQLLGEEVARAAARHMEYPYPESDERRIARKRPETSPLQ